MLTPPVPLPDFNLKDETGAVVTPETLKGHWTVLYFYPRDNTPGCTEQACSIRDGYADIKALGAEVYGISADPEKAHKKFIADHRLPFHLLIDADHVFAEAMDVWVEKSMYGKKYMGMERSTYIVNPEGIIVGAYQKVKTAGHAEFIAQHLRELQAA